MIMNLKQGSRYVVNRNEDLTTIDFDGDVSLTKKEVVVLSITMKILTTVDFDGNGSLAEKEQMILLEQIEHKLSLDNEREIGQDCSNCGLHGRTLQKGGAQAATVAGEGCDCNFWRRGKGRGGRRIERWEQRRSLTKRRLW
ncbi:hypothetical protein B296_00041973 [Ensete ventricosum]|uniref:EF-hand domain-containing protein n=1 Tax=Ensete ventricosum TaxID=4639 RepID=A0A426YQR1_ENSVE|nr:hypothetical protein B296_00041973 [Ensete ventricosum]